MTPVTRYLLADDVDRAAFSARLIRKVRALNFTVIAHCQTEAQQKSLIHALNRFDLEPQLTPQSGAIAVCTDATKALAETSNSIMLKLISNSLLLNLGDEVLTPFSRFERYAEIHPSSSLKLPQQAQWFQDRGYRVEDHNIFEA